MSDNVNSKDKDIEGPVHPQTRIGHVHLKVSDLERSVW
jgi:catechol-2,3-dioxygenase